MNPYISLTCLLIGILAVMYLATTMFYRNKDVLIFECTSMCTSTQVKYLLHKLHEYGYESESFFNHEKKIFVIFILNCKHIGNQTAMELGSILSSWELAELTK